MVILGLLLSTSCGMVYYKSPPAPPIGQHIPGPIGYEVHVNEVALPPTQQTEPERYVKAVEKALHKAGYSDPVLVVDGHSTREMPELKLIVRVRALRLYYDYGGAAAPQEWLTGLTLGAIPSWSTRHQVVMNFRLLKGSEQVREWEYMPEVLWINHLVLLPVGLFQLLTNGFNDKPHQVTMATKYFLEGSAGN